MTDNFTYEVDPNFADRIIEERGNTYIALRKIKWGSQKDFKLDIRKYIATAEGSQMRKGCTITDEGANELSRALLEVGYGKAEDISSVIVEQRKDIYASILKKSEDLSDSEKQDIISQNYIEDDDSDDYVDLNEVI